MRLATPFTLLLAIAVAAPLAASEHGELADAKAKLGRIKVKFPEIGVETEATAAAYQVDLERDQASGLPTGKRQHKPFLITKELDKSTPVLLDALTSGKVFRTVEVEIQHRLRGDTSVTIYTLENAQLVSYSSTSQPSDVPTEQVTLVFEKIKIVFDGGVTHEDDWKQPPGG
jgi:type VI secretion system secreted protein Hcp